MTRAVKILVVDDEKLIRWSLKQALTAQGHEVIEASRGDEVAGLVEEESPEIVLLDIRLPGKGGLEVLRDLRERHPEADVVMISAHGTLDMAVEAMKLGAVDYIRKPFETEEIELLVARLAQKNRLNRTVEFHWSRESKQYGIESLVGGSPPTEQVRQIIGKVASSEATNILVEGESGTGKGLVARILHYAGPRSRAPFVEVSCTALTESLVESELFGHERGAFTDAKTAKKGMFELADGGTIFLDEIGDMPIGAQAKLLRAIEDRTFKRVGGVRDLKVDVQVLAATNRALAEEVEKGRFRMDLFYRLAVLRVALAPLAERREDIPALCDHFIRHYNREFRRTCQGVSTKAMRVLQDHRWPGNVRELRNAIERALILGDRSVIEPEDLPIEVRPGPPRPIPLGGTGKDSARSLDEIERDLIANAIRVANGNQTKAAKALKISRDTLRYRMKKYALK